MPKCVIVLHQPQSLWYRGSSSMPESIELWNANLANLLFVCLYVWNGKMFEKMIKLTKTSKEELSSGITEYFLL